MRLSISSKITAVTIIGVLVSCLSVLAMSTFLLNRTFNAQLDEHVKNMRNVVVEYYHTMQTTYLDEARLIASDIRLIEAVASGDPERMTPIAQRYLGATQAAFLTITNAEGEIIARGHTTASPTGEELIERALAGRATAGIDSEGDSLTLWAAAPLLDGNAVVGTVSLGLVLASPNDAAFADALKTLTRMDITLFQGDVRAMSTITQNGKRIIGTPLNNPAVEKALAEGQPVFRNTAILGVPYKTAYWPMQDPDGENIGIWFIGSPTAEMEQGQRSALLLVLLGVLVIVSALAVASVIFSTILAKPIKQATAYAVAVAGGDLDATLNVRTRDEVSTLSDALRGMVDNLKTRIAEAERVSDEANEQAAKALEATSVAEAAGREAKAKGERILQTARKLENVVHVLSSASEGLAMQIRQSGEGASEQAERASETASAMTQMNSTVIEVARNAANASDVSAHTRQKAMEGSQVVEEMVRSIQEVQGNSQALKEDMTTLGEHAQSISQIMSVISDIADQTNLLALNAAIEAARAGEAGRGFAVVADEVRKLAEKTMSSTSDVSRATGAIQQSMTKSMEQVDVTARNIEYATELAARSGEALHEIVSMADDTAGQVQAIAAASEEQSAASEEISRSVSEVNAIAGETASAMAQAAHSVTELNEQAHILASLIEEMKAD